MTSDGPLTALLDTPFLITLVWPSDGVVQVRQYLVKLRGYSYNRLEWQREDEIEADGKLSKNALSRFLRKLATGEPIDREYVTYTQTLRIIGHRTEGGFGKEYLVKWGGLPYCECSWEYSYSVPAAAIDAYNVASNRLAVEAAKLQRDRDLGWLQKGRTLEVWPASDPLHELHGAWYGATALSLHETHVYIEYKHLLANEEDVDAGSLRERVPVHRVRPLPPKTKKDFRPEVGEVVSAEHLNGWWSGRVLAIAKRGEVLPDLRGAAVRAMEQQQLLQPPLNASEPSLSIGQTAEGRDGRQWQLLALEGSQRRIWQLLGSAVNGSAVNAQLLGGAVSSAGADEPPPSAVAVGVLPATVSAEAAEASEDETRGGEGGGGVGGGGTQRMSSWSDKAPPPTKPTTNAHYLRGISRSELPGSRIVVVYTEEADVAEAMPAMPEGGPELCGHLIEVYWPIDRAWYRCRVLRVVPGRRQMMYEVLYVDDDVRETLDLAKEEWRHVNTQVRIAYPGLLIKPTEVDGVPSLLVHFDGMEANPESAECFVDEDGEDEWMWESEFRLSQGMRVFKPEPLIASETMWFISGDGESSLAPIAAPPPLLLRLPLGAEMCIEEDETADGAATSAPALAAQVAPTAVVPAIAAVDAVSLPVEAPYGSGGDLDCDLDLGYDLAMVLDSGAYASTEPVVSTVVSAAAAGGASSASTAVATVISVSDVVSDAAECQRTGAVTAGGAAAPMVEAAIVGTASDKPAAKASAFRPPSALQSWKPLSAIRPNWRWSGVDETGNVAAGWRVGATMADGMPIEPRKASDPFADVEEDDEEEEAKLAAATAAEKAAAEKAAAGKAAADKAAADKAAAKKRRAEDGEEYVDGKGGGGGRRNGEEGEEEEESDGEEGEDETAIEVSGWKRLHSSPPVPSGRVLRPYQLEGVNWMRLNWYLGRNIILGDEMGLGKTAQSCMLLHTLRRFEHVEGPFLIVVPLSTLPHWERELSLWTDCYTVVYHGSAESRRVLLQWDWKLATPKLLPVDPSKPEGKKREYKYRFHCVLTTYETVVRHRS